MNKMGSTEWKPIEWIKSMYGDRYSSMEYFFRIVVMFLLFIPFDIVGLFSFISFYFISVPFIQLWMAERIETDIHRPIAYKLHVFVDVECCTASWSKIAGPIEFKNVECSEFRGWNVFFPQMKFVQSNNVQFLHRICVYVCCVIEFPLFVTFKCKQTSCSHNLVRHMVFRICDCMIMISVYLSTFVHSW